MLRFYHLDVWADLGTVGLTWRRLGVLVRQLPRESAFAHAVHGDDARWGDLEHLLAHVVDLLQVGNLQRWRGKGSRPKFEPIKRPGGSGRPKPVSPSDVFKRMRGG